jgi:hypothetical protein
MTIRTRFSKKEHTNSGLAFLLITLLVYFRYRQHFIINIALVELLAIMIIPVLFYPFTLFWMNLSEILGKLMSKVILTIIFFLFVCPVAIFRRFLGKDSLNLGKFKKDRNSVFFDRNHSCTKDNFITPY